MDRARGERGGVATAVARPRQSRAPAARLPGLDGLRALAIVAVVIFHLDPRWLPGGFLGVDVFFVVSGFLITTLLLNERAATGRVDLLRFWRRRARRLLPALLVVVPAAVLLARLSGGDLLVGVGRQLLGALTYTSNWLEIGAGSDYFGGTTPTLLAHLWSLAVEEQFYLLWPVVLLVLLRVVRNPHLRAAAVLGLGLGSSLLMALLLEPGSPTRVYYGTDTHATGLMVGAALALSFSANARAGTRSVLWERHRRSVGGVAALALLALFVLADERSALTFRGGILLASLATATLLLVVLDRPGRLRALLELPVLTWIGARSYGIYLWHWPVVLVVGQDLPLAPGGGGYVLTRLWAVLVTLAAADLTYRAVEMPVRRLGVTGAVAAVARALRTAGTGSARVWCGSALLAVLAVVAAVVTAPERTTTQEYITAREGTIAREVAVTDPEPRPTAGNGASGSTTPTPAADWSMPEGSEIDAYGDSMLVGASDAMEYWLEGVRIDGRSNRRWSQAPALVKARGDTGRRAVVLAFGTNFGTDATAVRRTLDALGSQRMVVVVTVHGRYARASADNDALREAVADRENVAVADWDAALSGTRGMLQSDGIHPSVRGAHLYTRTVRDAFAELSTKRTGTPAEVRPITIP